MPAAGLAPAYATVSIYFLKVDKSKGRYEDVLVTNDHLTRYAKAIPCRNQKANTAAAALYENLIVHYSFSQQLHSDNGRDSDRRVMKEICKIAHVRTAPMATQLYVLTVLC